MEKTINQALQLMDIIFSHEDNGTQVFNVLVKDALKYSQIRNAIVHHIENDEHPELVYSSRVVRNKPHVEVMTRESNKRFVIIHELK